MNLKFDFLVVGSIFAKLKVGDTVVKAAHSDTYGDKFQELLAEFMFVHFYWRTYDKDWSYNKTIRWYDDVCDYLWDIKVENPKSGIEIEIFAVSPDGGDYKQSLIVWKASLDELFDCIYHSLDGMLQKFGFWGYRENWCGNFPAGEYMQLKAERNNLPIKLVPLPEDDDWVKKVDLDDEINLLKW